MIFLGDAVSNRDLIGRYNPPHTERLIFRKEPKQTGWILEIYFRKKEFSFVNNSI